MVRSAGRGGTGSRPPVPQTGSRPPGGNGSSGLVIHRLGLVPRVLGFVPRVPGVVPKVLGVVPRVPGVWGWPPKIAT